MSAISSSQQIVIRRNRTYVTDGITQSQGSLSSSYSCHRRRKNSVVSQRGHSSKPPNQKFKRKRVMDLLKIRNSNPNFGRQFTSPHKNTSLSPKSSMRELQPVETLKTYFLFGNFIPRRTLVESSPKSILLARKVRQYDNSPPATDRSLQPLRRRKSRLLSDGEIVRKNSRQEGSKISLQSKLPVVKLELESQEYADAQRRRWSNTFLQAKVPYLQQFKMESQHLPQLDSNLQVQLATPIEVISSSTLLKTQQNQTIINLKRLYASVQWMWYYSSLIVWGLILSIWVFITQDDKINWFLILELALLISLISEVIGRMYLSGIKTYWKDVQNIFDIVVIIFGFVALAFIPFDIDLFHMISGLLIAVRSWIQLFRLIHTIRKSKQDQEPPVNLEFDSLDPPQHSEEDQSNTENVAAYGRFAYKITQRLQTEEITSNDQNSHLVSFAPFEEEEKSNK